MPPRGAMEQVTSQGQLGQLWQTGAHAMVTVPPGWIMRLETVDERAKALIEFVWLGEDETVEGFAEGRGEVLAEGWPAYRQESFGVVENPAHTQGRTMVRQFTFDLPEAPEERGWAQQSYRLAGRWLAVCTVRTREADLEELRAAMESIAITLTFVAPRYFVEAPGRG